MAHDDEKPDAGDDPWAGLEAEGLPDLEGDFSFSFDDGPPSEASAEASPTDAAPDEPAPLVEDVVVPDAVEDAAIDDWLNDGDAAASSILPFEAADHAALDGGDMADIASSESTVEIGSGGSGIPSPSSVEAAADSAVDGPFAAEDADPFAALSGEEAAGAAEEMFAFATEATTADISAVDGQAEGDGEAGGDDAIDAFAAVGAAGAVAADQVLTSGDGKPASKTTKRQPAPRRKQQSMIGQLVGVVCGGALAIPITLAILFWGLGKDPFGLAPMVPESLAFLLPPKFRPAAAFGTDVVDLAAAPTLDAAVGEPAAGDVGAGDAGGSDLAVDEAEPDPDATEASATDLAAVVPPPPAGQAEPGDDPLMDLLGEAETEPASVESAAVAAAVPAPPPEPEPLDLTELDAAVASATAALEAAAAVEDPTDPVRRRLLARWYRALAGYAEHLVSLESLAAETGRPFEPAAERAEALRASLAEHPLLFGELGMLGRDWIAYVKRPSDGLVMPATFVAARRVGPYWRSQVTLPATDTRPGQEMVVLTRVEPAVVPGDDVVVTGLVIDDDVIWAVEVRPAAADAGGFPGL